VFVDHTVVLVSMIEYHADYYTSNQLPAKNVNIYLVQFTLNRDYV